MATREEKFGQAAWAYFVYGVLYWATALYQRLSGSEVRGSWVWFVVGGVVAVGFPWLLARPRPWFERWVLSRRDFARILAVLVLIRAILVGWIALRGPEGMRMPSMGGGVPTSGAGMWLMALVALVTAAVLARAAWSRRE